MHGSMTSKAAAERLLPFSTVAALCLVGCGLFFFVRGPVLNAQAPVQSRLKILTVKIGPIQQGKNSVLIDVANSTKIDQRFAVAIQTRSPQYGRGLGWGTVFFANLEAQITKSVRFVFKIPGPITDDTWVRFRFYNPASTDTIEGEPFFQENKYSAGELPRAERKPNVWGSPTLEESAKAEQVFHELQNAIERGDEARAWALLTKDYRDAEYFGKPEVFKSVIGGKPPLSFYSWDRGEILRLKFQAAGRRGDSPIVKAGDGGESWIFVLAAAPDGGALAVDGIEGFTPRVVLQASWQERLLPKLKVRRTAQFDIYYYPDSAAEKDLDTISALRQRGFDQIREFLGPGPAGRIRLVLFEDGGTKLFETGHQGMGWAFDRTMVEVYNDAQKLDPYHELVHILAGPIGDPPAVFNEGLAVYLSERLGAKALGHLGGGDSTIRQRVSELRKQGLLIGLAELLSFREIGSKESRSDVSYPEAAGFVQFLVEQYGKEKFLDAYRRLKDPASRADSDRNAGILAEIYERTPVQLESDWLKSF